MPVLGVTGGIATGKTSFTTRIAAHLAAEVFDADRTARALLAGDEEIGKMVRAEFGTGVVASDGTIDRAKLREIVFGDEPKRRKLEAILHPAVRASWLNLLDARRTAGDHGWMILDIPLLYETKAEAHADAVAVVACSPATQRERLAEIRKLPDLIATQIITAQMDLSLKIQKADHVIWNDGTPEHLDAQAALLARHLQTSK